MSMTLGCATFLAGCSPKVSDDVGLEALREPLREVVTHTLRIQDPDLTSSVRNLAATWQAAKGE